jgi:transposase-like protein
MTFSYLGCCSGIGMLEKACEAHGGVGTLMVDNDPFCQRILSLRYPDVPLFGDLFDLDEDTIREVIMGRREPERLKARVDMYEAGFSLEEVAEYFEISRQAVWEMFKNAGVEMRPQRVLSPQALARRDDQTTEPKPKITRPRSKNSEPKKRNRSYPSDENPFYRGGTKAHDKSQNLVEAAVLRGSLVRPTTCSECGLDPAPFENGRTAIQAHHDDYNKPLEVRWLCQPCHHRWHRFNEAIPFGGDAPESLVDVVVGGF